MKVVIIGGGFSGVFAALQTIENSLRFNTELTLTLIEKSPYIGGAAYGLLARDEHVMNIPISLVEFHEQFESISVTPMLTWLNTGSNDAWPLEWKKEWTANDFCPRRLFGLYLEYICNAVFEQTEAIPNITAAIQIHVEATKIETHDDNTFTITLSTQETKPSDHIIFATGFEGSHFRTIVYPNTFAEKPYVPDLWHDDGIERVANIDPTESLLVIGTGLSAMDVLLTRIRRYHQFITEEGGQWEDVGKITLLSRHGLMHSPYPFSGVEPVDYQALPELTFDALSLNNAHGDEITLLDDDGNIDRQQVTEYIHALLAIAESNPYLFFKAKTNGYLTLMGLMGLLSSLYNEADIDIKIETFQAVLQSSQYRYTEACVTGMPYTTGEAISILARHNKFDLFANNIDLVDGGAIDNIINATGFAIDYESLEVLPQPYANFPASQEDTLKFLQGYPANNGFPWSAVSYIGPAYADMLFATSTASDKRDSTISTNRSIFGIMRLTEMTMQKMFGEREAVIDMSSDESDSMQHTSHDQNFLSILADQTQLFRSFVSLQRDADTDQLSGIVKLVSDYFTALQVGITLPENIITSFFTVIGSEIESRNSAITAQSAVLSNTTWSIESEQTAHLFAFGTIESEGTLSVTDGQLNMMSLNGTQLNSVSIVDGGRIHIISKSSLSALLKQRLVQRYDAGDDMFFIPQPWHTSKIPNIQHTDMIPLIQRGISTLSFFTIVAPAGHGKTQLIQKMLYDYSRDQILTNYSLFLFEGSLLTENSVRSPAQLFNTFFKDEISVAFGHIEYFMHFLREEKLDIIVIIDGLDELQSEFIDENLAECLLTLRKMGATCITTARPYTTSPNRSEKFLFLEALSPNKIRKFIQQELQQYPEATESSDGIDNFARQIVHMEKIDAWMSIPMNLHIICHQFLYLRRIDIEVFNRFAIFSDYIEKIIVRFAQLNTRNKRQEKKKIAEIQTQLYRLGINDLLSIDNPFLENIFIPDLFIQSRRNEVILMRFKHQMLRDNILANLLLDNLLESREAQFTEEVFAIDWLEHKEILHTLSFAIRDDSKTQEDLLHRWVIPTTDEPLTTTLPAVVITLLNYAGFNFSNLDLSRIHIPNADLSHCVLHCTNFLGSDLSGVDFRGSYLESADLSHCIMNDVKFGEALLAQSSHAKRNDDDSWGHRAQETLSVNQDASLLLLSSSSNARLTFYGTDDDKEIILLDVKAPGIFHPNHPTQFVCLNNTDYLQLRRCDMPDDISIISTLDGFDIQPDKPLKLDFNLSGELILCYLADRLAVFHLKSRERIFEYRMEPLQEITCAKFAKSSNHIFFTYTDPNFQRSCLASFDIDQPEYGQTPAIIVYKDLQNVINHIDDSIDGRWLVFTSYKAPHTTIIHTMDLTRRDITHAFAFSSNADLKVLFSKNEAENNRVLLIYKNSTQKISKYDAHSGKKIQTLYQVQYPLLSFHQHPLDPSQLIIHDLSGNIILTSQANEFFKQPYEMGTTQSLPLFCQDNTLMTFGQKSTLYLQHTENGRMKSAGQYTLNNEDLLASATPPYIHCSFEQDPTLLDHEEAGEETSFNVYLPTEIYLSHATGSRSIYDYLYDMNRAHHQAIINNAPWLLDKLNLILPAIDFYLKFKFDETVPFLLIRISDDRQYLMVSSMINDSFIYVFSVLGLESLDALELLRFVDPNAVELSLCWTKNHSVMLTNMAIDEASGLTKRQRLTWQSQQPIPERESSIMTPLGGSMLSPEQIHLLADIIRHGLAELLTGLDDAHLEQTPENIMMRACLEQMAEAPTFIRALVNQGTFGQLNVLTVPQFLEDSVNTLMANPHEIEIECIDPAHHEIFVNLLNILGIPHEVIRESVLLLDRAALDTIQIHHELFSDSLGATAAPGLYHDGSPG